MNALEFGAAPAGLTGGPPAPAPAPAGNAAPRPSPAPAVQASQRPAVDPDAGRKALDGAVSRIREVLNASSASVEFTLDDSSGRVVLRVVDGATKELIRQIPSDDVLALAHALDRVHGLLVREEA